MLRQRPGWCGGSFNALLGIPVVATLVRGGHAGWWRGFNALLGIPVVATHCGCGARWGAGQFQCPARHSGRCNERAGSDATAVWAVSMPCSAFRSLQLSSTSPGTISVWGVSMPCSAFRSLQLGVQDQDPRPQGSFNALLGIPVVATRPRTSSAAPVSVSMPCSAFRSLQLGPCRCRRRGRRVSMPCSAFRSLQPPQWSVGRVRGGRFQCPARHSGRCNWGLGGVRGGSAGRFNALLGIPVVATTGAGSGVVVLDLGSMPCSAFRSLQPASLWPSVRTGTVFQCPARHSGRCNRLVLPPPPLPPGFNALLGIPVVATEIVCGAASEADAVSMPCSAFRSLQLR